MFKIILFFIISAVLFSTVLAQNTKDNMSTAKTFIELLAKNDFAAGENYFDDALKSKITAAKLEEVWNGLQSQVGKYKSQESIKTAKSGSNEIVITTTEFENAKLNIQLAFDEKGKVVGLFFTPVEAAESAEKYQSPAYAKPELFTEKEVTVGSGELSLPATLTMPKGKGKFPVVVLVHGSGPNDRDETHINTTNKPFKDLAQGLASNGIAVLRYDKRTKVYGGKFVGKPFTVKEETVDDALAAVTLLRQTEGIDANKIFVLGHSLGGYLIPRIGERDPKIAGLISLAGTTRPLEDVILEQVTYLAMLDGSISKEEQSQIDKLKQSVAKVKSLKQSDANSAEVYLYIPASYWVDLQNYNPPLAAKSLKQPLLILQGERDYQVTMTDFQNWKNALKDRKNVSFKSYTKLNHLFMPGEGTPSPDDYKQTNHVSEQVVVDIADWVKRTK